MGQTAISILGNVVERRTEAEIYWVSDATEELIAVLYDTPEGWKTEVTSPTLVAEAGPDFIQAVEEARQRLSEYVNRRGDGEPDGLTSAGLSLWLLDKADGTSMGRSLGGKSS